MKRSMKDYLIGFIIFHGGRTFSLKNALHVERISGTVNIIS